MGSKRRVGMILIALAFGIATVTGLWLATQITSAEETTLFLIIGLAVVFVLPLAVGGIYLYVREDETEDEVAESLVLKQRELMDLLREHQQIAIVDAARSLDVTSDDIHEMVEQLIALDVFPGYIDREQGVLYAVPPKV